MNQTSWLHYKKTILLFRARPRAAQQPATTATHVLDHRQLGPTLLGRPMCFPRTAPPLPLLCVTCTDASRYPPAMDRCRRERPDPPPPFLFATHVRLPLPNSPLSLIQKALECSPSPLLPFCTNPATRRHLTSSLTPPLPFVCSSTPKHCPIHLSWPSAAIPPLPR
jgi:hypothetical protein